MATTAQLRTALVASLVAHGAVGGAGLWLTKRWARQEPPQHVLLARLVQLGPQKPKEMLPDKSAQAAPSPPVPDAAAPPAPVAPAAAVAVPAPPKRPKAQAKPAAPRDRQGGIGAALKRLAKQKQMQTQADGSVEGDADEAELGDAYAAEVYRCIKANYVIEGVEASQVASSRALVLLFVQSDGRIVRHKLLETSGVAAFDQAVSRAVERCGQVSPPPLVWRDRLRREGMEIGFQP